MPEAEDGADIIVLADAGKRRKVHSAGALVSAWQGLVRLALVRCVLSGAAYASATARWRAGGIKAELHKRKLVQYSRIANPVASA